MRTKAKRMRLMIAPLLLGAAFACGDALAQSPGSDANKSQNSLSDRLDETNGVIRPKQNLDPEMRIKPPRVNDSEAVIPPPGTPGGDPGARPK
jgi:hypothetical protein